MAEPLTELASLQQRQTQIEFLYGQIQKWTKNHCDIENNIARDADTIRNVIEDQQREIHGVLKMISEQQYTSNKQSTTITNGIQSMQMTINSLMENYTRLSSRVEHVFEAMGELIDAKDAQVKINERIHSRITLTQNTSKEQKKHIDNRMCRIETLMDRLERKLNYINDSLEKIQQHSSRERSPRRHHSHHSHHEHRENGEVDEFIGDCVHSKSLATTANVVPQETHIVPQKTTDAPQGMTIAPQETNIVAQETHIVPQATNIALQETNVAPQGANDVSSVVANIVPQEANTMTDVVPQETNVVPQGATDASSVVADGVASEKIIS